MAFFKKLKSFIKSKKISVAQKGGKAKPAKKFAPKPKAKKGAANIVPKKKAFAKKPAIKKAKPPIKKWPKLKVKPKLKTKLEPKQKKPALMKRGKRERVKKLEILPPTLKITNKVIEDLISNLAGEDVPPLVNFLKDKKNVSEFKLAEQINLTVNQVRNMLYRLSKHSLVTFVRKKDKKKGWYVYYWTLDMDNIKEALLKFKKDKLEEFKQRLENEQAGTFFVCPNACMRLKYETAMEYDFKCQECGQLLQQQENARTISNIKSKIKELEEELNIKSEGPKENPK